MHTRKTNISIAILALMALFVLPSNASASYYAKCFLHISIQKIIKPVEKVQTIHRVKVKLKVLKIGYQTGHTQTYCSERKMQGKSFEVFLLTGKKELTKQVQKGANIHVRFSYFSGRTRRGVSRSTTWWLRPTKAKPTKAKAKPAKAKPAADKPAKARPTKEKAKAPAKP